MTLRPGKLPNPVLAELLASFTRRDERVLVGPGVGRDAAVIKLGDTLLIAKSDPVTFATEHVAWYAVNVNANDVACMGARPVWFLATALLPPGAPDSLPRTLFAQLSDACDRLGVELVGGHTEVTIGLDRPLIAGTMLGLATRDEIVTGDDVRPGDRVLLTKGIAIEGTALLARESPDALAARGVDAAAIRRAADLLFHPGISVVPDARAVAGVTRPHLMHDPTEGGLATALDEMAAAAGATLRVDLRQVPVLPETRVICDALGLHPFGLLASGALLAVVSPEACDAVAAALSDVKIECHTIGWVESGPSRVIMEPEDQAGLIPRFDRDELARFYEGVDGDEGREAQGKPEGS
jgi:hydrogenase expression/formation protein HypE